MHVILSVVWAPFMVLLPHHHGDEPDREADGRRPCLRRRFLRGAAERMGRGDAARDPPISKQRDAADSTVGDRFLV